MTTTADFLHEAYLHIEAGNAQYAKALLESLLSIEPVNTEAWEAYMQLCQTCEELDYLCEQVTQVAGHSSADLESILDYYYFLRQKMKAHQAKANNREMITFELVEQFTYTLKDHSAIHVNVLQDKFSAGNLFSGLLEKSIVFFYIVLLIIGVRLLANEIQFGYWILLVLAVSIIANAWNMAFPETKRLTTKKSHPIDIHPDATPSQFIL